MSVETLTHIQTLHAENTAFNLEYIRPINESSLRDDIISYLGEYRFKVPTYDYELYYSLGNDNAFALRDIYDGDLMTNKAKGAIKRKEDLWKSPRREIAELSGLLALERQLEQADSGDLVLWVSPPGPKEENYGNYGFVYIGSVAETDDCKKRVSMTAFRIEDDPSIEKFNFYLSLASGLQTNFKSDTDFLSNPIVVRSPLIRAKQGLFEVFNFDFNKKTQQRFLNTIKALSPLINELIRLTQEDAPHEERKRILNALENLTTDLNVPLKINFDQRLNDLRILGFYEAAKKYGHEPERVMGSCGSSGTTGSNDILSNDISSSIGDIDLILDNNEKDDMFECPSCHQLSKPPVGNRCPKCNITFEEYEAQSRAKGESVCKQCF